MSKPHRIAAKSSHRKKHSSGYVRSKKSDKSVSREEYLESELNRQKEVSTKVRDESEKRLVKMADFHEKQLKELHGQHDKDLKLLNHQHTLHLKSLRQSYDVKIQKLLDDQKTRENVMRKDSNEKTKSTIEDSIAKQDAQTKAQIDELKSEMESQVKQMTQKYQSKIQELQETTAKLEQSENLRLQLQKQQVLSDQNMEKSERERMSTIQDLSSTKNEIKTMKKQYESQVSELKNALSVSRDQLQGDYELITALKEDKTKYIQQIQSLSKRLTEQESDITRCSMEKKQLNDQLHNAQIDTKTYKQEMHKIIDVEKTQSLAAEKTKKELQKYEDNINECKSAIAQAQKDMDQEKSKHIALRKEYQNHLDRLTAINEALEKCRQKSKNSESIIQEMNERYLSLKSRSDQMTEEMKKISEESSSYKSGLEMEKKRLEKVKQDLDQSRAQMQEKLQHMESNDHHTHQILDECSRKNDNCLKSSQDQSDHIGKLEAEIKRAMQIVKNEELLQRKMKVMDEAAAVREKELTELRKRLEKLQDENKNMNSVIKEFDSHHDADTDLARKHSHLKMQQEKTLKWVEEMKKHHQDLHDHHVKVNKNLEEANKKLDLHESNMQKAASEIRVADQKIADLTDRIAKCLYPGQKEMMESSLRDLIREKDTMKGKMDKMLIDHNMAFKKIEALEKENEDLRVNKQRYEMEEVQMQKIVEQGAQLNVDLNDSRKMIQKKDQQLELLSSQLATLIHRVKTLEERETILIDKLKYSSSPEEVDSLNQSLSNCKLEMKRNVAKFQEMQQIAEKMKEQNDVNKTKVNSLVQVLKDSEIAKNQLETETEQKNQLRHALKNCSEERRLTAEQLEHKMKLVEDQYGSSLLTHEKMMTESNARISDLQQKLMQAVEMERATRLKVANEPMKRLETVEKREKNLEEIIYELKGQLKDLQSKQLAHGSRPEIAIETAYLPQMNNLQEVKQAHAENMRDKERQIMQVRQNTYENLLSTLESANRNPNVAPNDLYTQIRDIRVKGARREQQAMADMLELRSINTKLATEYRSARQVQSEMLAQANTTQRNQIIRSAQMGSTPEVLASVNSYQSLAGAQRDFLSSQQNDVTSQLQYQKQYINELERQLPLMNNLVSNINTQRFPNLNVLQQDVNKEQRITIGALGNETNESLSQQRSLSANELQLQSLQAQIRMLTNQAKQYADNPSSENANMLQQLSQLSPSQMALVERRRAAEEDNSMVRKTALIGNRPASFGPPGKNMTADPLKAELTVNNHKFLFDNVLLPSEVKPQTAFAPTLARVEDQISKGKDLIVVTYSFNTHDNENLKYNVFAHAVDLLFPRLQQMMGQENKIRAQLVKVTANDRRQDMLADPNKPRILADKCTYRSCDATVIEFKRQESLNDYLSALKPYMQDNKPSENHLVLTFSSASSKSRVHIVDVLFHKINQHIPEVSEMKLLDNSWVSYLGEVIQDPDVKVDLFANFVSFKVGDKETEEANRRIAEVTDRIKYFIYQVHNTTQQMAQ